MSAFLGTACAYLAEIAKACIDAGLGISTTIEIIEAASVTSIPAPDVGTHTVSTDIVVDTGARWYPWKIGGAAEFNSTAKGTKGNQTFNNVLTVFIPVSRDAVDKVINDLLNGEFVIRFGTITGEKRLMGTEFSPVMIAEGGIIEAISNETNGVTVTFENTGKTPFFYTGAVSFTPAV